MQPGIDSLPEEDSVNIQSNKLETDEADLKQLQAISPETVINTKKTPEARRRLRTNDAALEQINYYGAHQKPFDPDHLKIKKFTNWIDVVVSENKLLAHTIKAIEKTLDWFIHATRQQNRLEKYWQDLRVTFHNYLIELQQKN